MSDIRAGSAETRKNLIGKTAPNESDLQAMRKAVWHKQGVLVVDPEDIKNWEDKQHLINIGNKLHGKRAEK